MDIDTILFVGFILYIFFQLFTPSKKKKGQAKAVRKNRRKKGQQVPSNKKQSLEEILQDMYQQQTGQALPSSEKTIQVESESEVFTYDKEYQSYDEEYASSKHEYETFDKDYEGEAYDKRRAKEIKDILDTRHKGEHVSQTLHNKIEQAARIEKQKKKKKKSLTKDFKFNAKDAIIYDVIMHRKYK